MVSNMNFKNKTASALLYFASFLCIIISLVYLFTPAILPYHVKFLGKTHEQLDPKTAELLLYAMRIIGGTTLSIGIVLAILTKNIQTGQGWIRTTIFIMMTVMCAVTEYVMLNVGLFTPWWVIAIAYAMTCAGLLLIKPELNRE